MTPPAIRTALRAPTVAAALPGLALPALSASDEDVGLGSPDASSSGATPHDIRPASGGIAARIDAVAGAVDVVTAPTGGGEGARAERRTCWTS